MTETNTAAARLMRLATIYPEHGLAWRGVLPSACDPASGLRLFENGVEVGPGHCRHRDIREQGGGRFSWYQGGLWFSTSDHSDPRRNGRDYVALVSGSGPGAALVSAAEQAAGLPDDTPETARHELLRQFAALAYPGFSLPDFGRRIDADADFHRTMGRFFGDRATAVAVDRRYALRELAGLAMTVPGEIAECGCHSGAGAYLMAEAVRRAGGARTLHLFDSFSGLSPPGTADGGHWRAGDLACSLETTRANLAEFPFVRFHPGWIPETFAAVADVSFALVHIDVDLYQPTHESLGFFWERLVAGGLLVCDDYGLSSCPGATAAIDGFFAGRPEPIVNLSAGGALVIKAGTV